MAIKGMKEDGTLVDLDENGRADGVKQLIDTDDPNHETYVESAKIAWDVKHGKVPDTGGTMLTSEGVKRTSDPVKK